jgi:multidrug transporter EmrE-like cation transporter
LYGVLDSALKALTDLFRQGGLGAALASPWSPVSVLAMAAAFFSFQRALQENRALTAIGLMEAGAATISIVAGFVAFGDRIGATEPLAIVHVIAFASVVVAVWLLAPVQEGLDQRSARR